MAWYAKFDGVDGTSESRSAPNVSEIVVTKDLDSAQEGAFFLHLQGIDGEATSSRRDLNDMYVFRSPDSTAPSFGGAGDDVLIGGMLLGDGSVRDTSPQGFGMGWSWGLDRIDQRAPAAAAGEFPYIVSFQDGGSDHPAGINVLFADGSVRDISPQDAAFFAYDQSFLGGVVVAAGDIGDGVDAIIFAGDRYDPVVDHGFDGGLSAAVAEVEGKGPHMLMQVGYMF